MQCLRIPQKFAQEFLTQQIICYGFLSGSKTFRLINTNQLKPAAATVSFRWLPPVHVGPETVGMLSYSWKTHLRSGRVAASVFG